MKTADALTNFVYQLYATVFPTLDDFSASSTSEALKWKDLVQDTVHQIVLTLTGNTQHGPSVILSLQKADRSCCSAWACGILTKELLQNHMVMNSWLFVRPTGQRARLEGHTIRINCCSVDDPVNDCKYMYETEMQVSFLPPSEFVMAVVTFL